MHTCRYQFIALVTFQFLTHWNVYIIIIALFMYAFCVYFMHIIVLSCMFIPVEIYAIDFKRFVYE